MGRSDVFSSTDVMVVCGGLRDRWAGLIDEIDVELSRALDGSADATLAFLVSYRRLTSELVSAAFEGEPDWAGRTVAWDLSLATEAVKAPVNPWVDACGRGNAIAIAITSRVRHDLLGQSEVPAPESWVDRKARCPLDQASHQESLQRFQRQVLRYLAASGDEHPLERIQRVFGLSKAQLGGLFGVSRQAIDGWLATKVPAERQEKVTAILALADLLERKLKAGRIAGVARRPADAYGGETMLAMIASDRHRELLDSVRESFNWAQAA